MAGILGGIIGNVIGSTISGAINAVGNANKHTSGGTSQSSTSKGSASNVNVYDDNQQAIRDQMNANSQAWYQATSQAEKDRLHAENEYLAGLLGGNVSYNGSTGTWSGSAGAPSYPELPGYVPTDNRAYLEELSKAYLEQQEEALRQAYEQNLSDLQAEQDKLTVNYQAARNQEAADSALSRQRWNETAAAYGLNSGTAGQAQLSFANQLQSGLSALHAAESATNQEIERQRTNLGKEYQSALAQAQAENNWRLFEQLYNEAVRIDQALQNQSQFNATQSLKKYQTMLDQYYNDRDFRYQTEQDARAEQLEAAAIAAEMGDYSLFGQLFGWDNNRVTEMNRAWQSEHAPKSSSGGSSGSGSSSNSGSSSSSSSSATETESYDLARQAYAAGCRTYDAAVAYFKSRGYGDGLSQDLAKRFERRLANGEIGVNQSKVNQLYNNLVDMRNQSPKRNEKNFVANAIVKYSQQSVLKLNEDEARVLLERFGYDPEPWLEKMGY